MLESWKDKSNALGFIRLPFSPSQDAAACSLCHYHVDVPDHYYQYGGGEVIPFEGKYNYFLTQ